MKNNLNETPISITVLAVISICFFGAGMGLLFAGEQLYAAGFLLAAIYVIVLNRWFEEKIEQYNERYSQDWDR